MTTVRHYKAFRGVASDYHVDEANLKKSIEQSVAIKGSFKVNEANIEFNGMNVILDGSEEISYEEYLLKNPQVGPARVQIPYTLSGKKMVLGDQGARQAVYTRQ